MRKTSDIPGFAELCAATNYSFLYGASHPSAMVLRAYALGLRGVGIADRNTVAGVVRAHITLRRLRKDAQEKNITFPDFRLAVGARLVFSDGTPDIIAYPATRFGWGRLTRLLTVGNMRAVKGGCILHLSDLLAHSDDLLLIILPESSATGQQAHKAPLVPEPPHPEPILAALTLVPPEGATPILRYTIDQLNRVASGNIWLAVRMNHEGNDARRLHAMQVLAAEKGIPLLATSDALYADAVDRPLQDILTAIRHGVTISEAGFRLAANAERHLKPPAEMARLFAQAPHAIDASITFLNRIHFTLDDLKYEYPHEPVPQGWEPQSWLEHLVEKEAERRFPNGVPDAYRQTMDEEFALIRSKKYACYFLTVHDIVQYARSLTPPILCQGRGSAANSLVCYFLGITPIDPVDQKLLFTRFLSEDRDEPPDIDVDFEHERREEVMQYVYRRFGRHRAGIAATVIHYRQRSVIREVGKALGFSEDVTARMAGTIWGSWGAKELPDDRIEQAGFDTGNPAMRRFKSLVDQLLNFPRHLSQHVGGFVLTEGRLDETVPIHHAVMEDRSFIEWDKDDIDALGLMKVDVLALGMLTCIRKSFDLMRRHGLGDLVLDTVPKEDEATYKMLQKGDSIGTFQVESRAQISMLPRLRPETLYDLAIQVAIVRPGPIQGGMVHPYLRRRNKEEKADLPGSRDDPDELKDVLGKTLGVPLFQEQAMKLAIIAAHFTPAEANALRRSMATFRSRGTMGDHQHRLIEGMVRRGYAQDFSERCAKQIEGFGDYGFPESHAQAFAWLAYVSSWLKCHHPAVFTCALLNAQPMGFYAPAQLVRDAREHGVEVRPPDINYSEWDNILEPRPDGALALRLGFRQIDGFREDWAHQLIGERIMNGAFRNVDDCARRTDMDRRALHLSADGDAMGSMALSRRNALWATRRTTRGTLPLFEAAGISDQGTEPDMALPLMPAGEEVAVDYQTLRLSLKGHPLEFLRGALAQEGVMTTAAVNTALNDAWVKTAGLVLVRQRPGNGKAIFLTLEDETGIANALLWERLFARYRRPVMAARLMLVTGQVQRSKEDVVHLIARRIEDKSILLDQLFENGLASATPLPRAHHPRNVRLIPKSRDFH